MNLWFDFSGCAVLLVMLQRNLIFEMSETKNKNVGRG